jgi:predicted transcriptional regulator YheO
MEPDKALERERDAVIAALTPVVEGIAATFGPVCEAVLHDYRRPETSVVAVAGSVTGRKVGGAMSEIGMRVLARGDEAADELNYLTRTGEGALVKSSTMVLRDSTGAVFGALCLNLDMGAISQAQALLGGLAGLGGPEGSGEPGGPGGPGVLRRGARGSSVGLPVTTFANDIDSVVEAIVDAHQLHGHHNWSGLDRSGRLELFRSLDEHGVFAVRRSVEQVAGRLGISRASAYNYLSQARATDRTESDATPNSATDRATAAPAPTTATDRATSGPTPKGARP